MSSNEECPICLTVIPTSGFAKTSCGHSFCLNCLVTHISNKNDCPMCRAKVIQQKPDTLSSSINQDIWAQFRDNSLALHDAYALSGYSHMASDWVLAIVQNSNSLSNFVNITDNVVRESRARIEEVERTAQQAAERYRRYREGIDNRNARKLYDTQQGVIVGARFIINYNRTVAGRTHLRINVNGHDDYKTAIVTKIFRVNMELKIDDGSERLIRVKKYNSVIDRRPGRPWCMLVEDQENNI